MNYTEWLVCRENCAGCGNYDGFGCERSPIVKENDEVCRCDERKEE